MHLTTKKNKEMPKITTSYHTYLGIIKYILIIFISNNEKLYHAQYPAKQNTHIQWHTNE